MQHQPLLWRRPHLEAGLVARDGGEVVPDPAGDFLRLLDAAKAVWEGGLVTFELGGGEGGVLCVPALEGGVA